MSPREAVNRRKIWKYLSAGLIAVVILVPFWIIFVTTVIPPETLTTEQAMNDRMKWWIAGPLGVVGVFFGLSWMVSSQQASLRTSHAQSAQSPLTVLSEQEKREYVLEVIGLGVTLDKYRQGKVWEALQQGSPFKTIREQDPEKYPWSEMQRSGISGGRAGDTLENGAQYTPKYYGVPAFNAQSPTYNVENTDTPDSPILGLAASVIASGMAWHLFVAGGRRFDEHPDRILEDVFAFFDSHPDVPYVILNSNDDMYFRDLFRPVGSTPLIKNGNYIPEMPDSSALFVLARRERVDPVRPFVWNDPENEFVQNVFRSMYAHLMAAVPHPRREKKYLRTPSQVGADPIRHTEFDGAERQPTVSEWLEASAAFAQRPDIRGSGAVGLVKNINPFAHLPPTDWKPTPWFPIPWNKEQLATFDSLPTLGFVHRPVFVKFSDEQGKQITRRDERERVLQAGWQAALQTLPEGERAKGPALVIAATGENAGQVALLHSVLNAYATNGGPEIDTSNSGQFIDTDKRLGNTGATTLFMQMAIGVMGSYRNGGVSAAVNLRNQNEASIVFVSPPTDDQRKTQQHPYGGDVFAHRGTPLIDPADYQ
jgi:hypothetical protein